MTTIERSSRFASTLFAPPSNPNERQKPGLPANILGFGGSAALSFPVWRAAANAQSGIALKGKTPLERAINNLKGPHRGFGSFVGIASFCRPFIFYGSDRLIPKLKQRGIPEPIAQVTAPAILAPLSCLLTLPAFRSTVLLQNPKTAESTVRESMIKTYSKEGIKGLFAGGSAEALRCIPKYTVACLTKSQLNKRLPEPSTPSQQLNQSVVVSTISGLTSVLASHPLEVLRNVKMKPEHANSSYRSVTEKLWRMEGPRFLMRGLGYNLASAGIPIATGLYAADHIQHLLNPLSSCGD